MKSSRNVYEPDFSRISKKIRNQNYPKNELNYMMKKNNYMDPVTFSNKENMSMLNNIPFKNSLQIQSKELSSKSNYLK